MLRREQIPTPFDAYRDLVRGEWIDHNGHMNMGYYLVVFGCLQWTPMGACGPFHPTASVSEVARRPPRRGSPEQPSPAAAPSTSGRAECARARARR